VAEGFSPPKLAQVSIRCADLGEARAFYCDTLGLEAVGQFGDSLFVRCGEVNLIIQAVADPTPGAMIYFGADGCIREAAHDLAARGIAFTQAPRRIARNHQGVDVWLAFFNDPWGNPLGLLANMAVED
jgi:catechol 2,3-dioxygenase-like lactoylglutathione lyase family enzyme